MSGFQRSMRVCTPNSTRRAHERLQQRALRQEDFVDEIDVARAAGDQPVDLLAAAARDHGGDICRESRSWRRSCRNRDSRATPRPRRPGRRPRGRNGDDGARGAAIHSRGHCSAGRSVNRVGRGTARHADRLRVAIGDRRRRREIAAVRRARATTSSHSPRTTTSTPSLASVVSGVAEPCGPTAAVRPPRPAERDEKRARHSQFRRRAAPEQIGRRGGDDGHLGLERRHASASVCVSRSNKWPSNISASWPARSSNARLAPSSSGRCGSRQPK